MTDRPEDNDPLAAILSQAEREVLEHADAVLLDALAKARAGGVSAPLFVARAAAGEQDWLRLCRRGAHVAGCAADELPTNSTKTPRLHGT